MPTTVEAPVAAVCSECDASFQVTVRTARRHRNTGGRPVCPSCRTGPRASTAAEREPFRAWWLERHSRDELLEIGRMIWPELAVAA